MLENVNVALVTVRYSIPSPRHRLLPLPLVLVLLLLDHLGPRPLPLGNVHGVVLKDDLGFGLAGQQDLGRTFEMVNTV